MLYATSAHPGNVRSRISSQPPLVGDDLPIQVDGGISAQTIASVADEGATLFVAGSAIFRTQDPAAAYREIAQAVGLG